MNTHLQPANPSQWQPRSNADAGALIDQARNAESDGRNPAPTRVERLPDGVDRGLEQRLGVEAPPRPLRAATHRAPVTSHPAHDVGPVFSPDGRMLAFSSNRHGSYDVYVVPVQGGRPRRLTFDSATDMVCGWTPDGKHILFASSRSTSYPTRYELFKVPLEGGMARRITTATGKEGVFSPTGDRLAYVRGPGDWYRKGYRGSSNDDIWICDADGTNNDFTADIVRVCLDGQWVDMAKVGRQACDNPLLEIVSRPPDIADRAGS